MSRLRLCPPRETSQKDTFQFKELDTCTHIFLRRIAISPPLTAPYDGPYKVVSRRGRVLKILRKGKIETVTEDRVKPAHMEREPESDTILAQQPALPRQTIAPRSPTIGARLPKPIAPRSDAIGARLPKPVTLYKAPHTHQHPVPYHKGRTPIQTYSRIPLNLRNKDNGVLTPHSRTDVQSSNHTVHKDKQLVETRFGRKIHTPARFVQLVHAVVAPDDIYSGTSYTSRYLI